MVRRERGWRRRRARREKKGGDVLEHITGGVSLLLPWLGCVSEKHYSATDFKEPKTTKRRK